MLVWCVPWLACKYCTTGKSPKAKLRILRKSNSLWNIVLCRDPSCVIPVLDGYKFHWMGKKINRKKMSSEITYIVNYASKMSRVSYLFQCT